MPVATTTYYTPHRYEAAHFESTPVGTSIPVVIVGAGPVGNATALGLAQRGIKVTLVDSGLGASYGSRATCYSRHTCEVADRLGYGDILAKRGLGWTSGRSYYRDKEVLRFHMPYEPHSVRDPMYNLGQCEYEDMQLSVIIGHPNITVLWGTTLTRIVADDEGVTLSVDSVDGPRTLRAQRVVASDGGRSTVRDLLNLKLQGTAYEGRYVIADIHWKSPLQTERRVWFDPPSNPGSTVIMHKQPDDIWRIDYQLSDHEDAEVETTREAIMERITKHLAWLESNGTFTKHPWTLEWHSFYKALALALPDFAPAEHHRRVIFAGDAAHLVPIFGVRGLNSGMEDADTLSWMLAAVVSGDADDTLLDAYSSERHDAWEQNISNAGKSTRIMTPGTDGYRMTRDALLEVSSVMPEYSHLINPRQSTATHALRSPLTVPSLAKGQVVDGLQPGQPLDDRSLSGGFAKSLSLAHGLRFGMYAIAPEQASKAELDQVFDRLQKAVPHIGATMVPIDPNSGDGTAKAWRAVAGEVVIVRPDGLVLARGTPKDLLASDFDARLKGRWNKSKGTPVSDPVLLTEEQVRREKTWLQLSEAINLASDKQAMLTRLALVLGAEAGPERMAEVLKKVL